MKRTCLFLSRSLVLACGLLLGCQVPPAPKDPLAGVKVRDLKDTSADLKNADFLISFRVFEYHLDPNSLDQMAPLYTKYPTDKIHFQNQAAFRLNQFETALIPHQNGGDVARLLNRVGGLRIGQASMSFPPSSTEILSSTTLNQAQYIAFTGPGGNQAGEYFYPGYMGWTITAESSAIRSNVLLKIAPAYWQSGAEDLRLKFNKPPIDFKPFEFLAFQTRLSEGDVILLAPSRLLAEVSVNQALFLQAGKKRQARCFVVICESAGL